MKVEIRNTKFKLFNIKAPKIKGLNVIEEISNIYEVENSKLQEGKNIFIFLNEDEGVFSENINIDKAYYIEEGEYITYLYKTINNNLVFYKSKILCGNTTLKVKKFKYNNEGIVLSYLLNIINHWEVPNKIILRERQTLESLEFPMVTSNNKICIPAKSITKSGIYDFFLSINVDNNKDYIIRIGKYRFIKSIFLKTKEVKKGNDLIVISPYTTYKGNNLSLKVDIIKEKYNKLLYQKSSKKDVWLIGEQKSKAQDNGYYFFKYMRDNHPEKNVYYVIDKNSSDYKKVQKLSNVIDFGSEEHFKAIGCAKYIISTHHPDYLFPTQNFEYIKNHKAKKIFLQHGIMGTKYMSNFYGNYNNNNFNVDMFIVSSQREKEMIAEDFEFDANNIRITGLARFDNLFKKDTELVYEVLIIPTWRDWLSNEFHFEETEYFKNYVSLVKKIQKKYKIIMILHINMGQYKKYFTNLNIDVKVADEVDVQKIMKQSLLMITDYSSVSFDFSFLEKPVIYYQFDQDKFFGSQGSHFDIYEELPGKIVLDEMAVINELEKFSENNYKINDEILKKINRLIKYKDSNSSHRIYEEIIKDDYKNKRKWYKRKFFKRGFGRYRTSVFYYPTMKFLYNSLKFLPKKDYVLIECNNGKSFTDSPRELYLKWSKMFEEQKFIIVYNRILPKKYKNNTKSIKRLSPSYFYYLARSKYWINNQNFPYYIKNYNTIYLQTWHGTPIKRMLNDLEQIVGRDDGYKKRVQTAINQWTYILSISDYTTQCFSSAFKYKAKTIQKGFPRNDIYFKDMSITQKKLKEKYQVKNEKKVILFAPTFRDNGQKIKGKYIQDLHLDYLKLKEKLMDDYIFLIKLHPLAISKDIIKDDYKELFRFVDSEDDINDVMLITDILITDYSSVMFDYLLADGKTILFAPDLKEYEFDNRGFYLDYENEAPGIVVKTNEDLIEEILNENITYDKETFKKKYVMQISEVAEEIINIIKQ